MDVLYCRRCGSELTKDSETSLLCVKGHRLFLNPLPAVGVFFLNETRDMVTLSVRGIEPSKGMLDAFGGFLDVGESFEQCAIRELDEELSLSPEDYAPLQYFTSSTMLYEYQGEDLPVTTACFWTSLSHDGPLSPRDDVADVVTLPLKDMDLSRLHADDIRAAILELQRLFVPR